MPLSRLITASPTASSSTGISPRGVAMRVPGEKQVICNSERRRRQKLRSCTSHTLTAPENVHRQRRRRSIPRRCSGVPETNMRTAFFTPTAGPEKKPGPAQKDHINRYCGSATTAHWGTEAAGDNQLQVGRTEADHSSPKLTETHRLFWHTHTSPASSDANSARSPPKPYTHTPQQG